jgi:ADP-heptose:LPS heptosyltransferase
MMNTNNVDTSTLKHLAFERQYETTFWIWFRFDGNLKQQALTDKYIVLALCHYAGMNLKFIASIDNKDCSVFAHEFQELLVEATEAMLSKKIALPQEWLEGLNNWSEGLLNQHLLSLANAVLNLADAAQAQRFPAIRQALIATRAKLDILLGNVEKAESAALNFALRPYLLPSRGNRPILYRQFMSVLLSVGRINEYRTLLWRGIYELYSDDSLRFWFIKQVKSTYKGNIAAVFFAEAPISMRLAFITQLVWMRAANIPLFRYLPVAKALRLGALAFIYYLNYRRPNQIHYVTRQKPKAKVGGILVTRAMGGLGDLLMMTAGLRALRKKYPQETIHFAIPNAFFPLLEGNDDFECIDIEATSLQTTDYTRWYDLTDCPAGRIETMELPNIKSNRIEIFAAAMGITKKELAHYGYTPRYEISADERREAEEYIAKINPDNKKIIGIQANSAETYRNWLQIEELAFKLSQDSLVLVFNNQAFEGYEGANIIKVVKPLRASFAIVAQCDLIISPDSSFVHLAAALSLPAIGIFGPTSGKVISRHYLKSKPIMPNKQDFPCSPCYRNENLVCNLAGSYTSVCLANIKPTDVLTAMRS